MTLLHDSTVAPNIFDAGSLAALKRQIKAGDPAANRAVAKQFEALFLQMVLKSMRDATPREGLFDSEQTRMYESLLDQQLGQMLGGGGRGTGLAALLEAQLNRQNPEPQPIDGPLPLHPQAPAMPLSRAAGAMPLPPSGSPPAKAFPLPAPVTGVLPAPTFSRPVTSGDAMPDVLPETRAPVSEGQRAFVERLLPAALAAEKQTGIPAHFMVAQAALETGWGKSEPRLADGRPSFNVFGIKAGSRWTGPVVEASTTEVISGIAQRRVERFRVYDSYAAAFGDYAQLMTRNPRYAAVLHAPDAASFARNLQAAGFATDPHYAAKLERILGGAALRQTVLG